MLKLPKFGLALAPRSSVPPLKREAKLGVERDVPEAYDWGVDAAGRGSVGCGSVYEGAMLGTSMYAGPALAPSPTKGPPLTKLGIAKLTLFVNEAGSRPYAAGSSMPKNGVCERGCALPKGDCECSCCEPALLRRCWVLNMCERSGTGGLFMSVRNMLKSSGLFARCILASNIELGSERRVKKRVGVMKV